MITDRDTEHLALRITVCHEHELFRTGLRALLIREPTTELVCEHSECEKGEQAIRLHQPDIAIVDTAFVGDRRIRRMRDDCPRTRYLVVSSSPSLSPRAVRYLFSSGAGGVLPSSASSADLRQAIRQLAKGEGYIHPSLGLSTASAELLVDPLTDREREIAALVALGHTNHEIANQMFVSIRTVETHRAHIMTKLHLRGRAQLVHWALQRGVIGAEPERETLQA